MGEKAREREREREREEEEEDNDKSHEYVLVSPYVPVMILASSSLLVYMFGHPLLEHNARLHEHHQEERKGGN